MNNNTKIINLLISISFPLRGSIIFIIIAIILGKCSEKITFILNDTHSFVFWKKTIWANYQLITKHLNLINKF